MRNSTASAWSKLSWMPLAFGLLLAAGCSGGAEQVDSTFSGEAADEAYRLGVDAHRRGQLAEAERHLRRALATNPRYLDAMLQLGEVLVEAGQPSQALSVFNDAIGIRDRSGEAWAGKASALLAMGRADDAAAAAEEAIRRGFVEESSFVLALSLERAGDIDGAVEVLEGLLVEAPARSDVRAELGRLYVFQGRPAQAVPVLERGARLHPDDIVIWFALADLYDAMGNWERAVETWQYVGQLLPGDPIPLVRLGSAQINTGNHRLAIQTLDQALALDRTVVGAYVLRGEAEFHRGFLDRAANNADTALQLDGNDAGALSLRAEVYAREGQVRAAIVLLERAVERRPADLRTAMLLAELYIVDEHPGAAIQLLERYAGATTDTRFMELQLNAYLAAGDSDLVLRQLIDLIAERPDEHSRILSLVQVALASPTRTLVTADELVEYAARGVEMTRGFRLEYRLGLIDALAAAGRQEEALAEARVALEDLPNNPELIERVRALD